MSATALLTTLTSAGCRLIPDGDTLRVQDPQRTLTDEWRQAIREHKPALLALLRDESPAHTPLPSPEDLPHVGRHGKPCSVCGELWQWPTTKGPWVCRWCACAGPETPQGQRGGEPETGHTYCPGCRATDLERQGDHTTCTACHAFWLPSIDVTQDSPTATIRVKHPETGTVLCIGIYRCPTCQETRWGPRLDNPDVWCCLTCASASAVWRAGTL